MIGPFEKKINTLGVSLIVTVYVATISVTCFFEIQIYVERVIKMLNSSLITFSADVMQLS